MGGLRRLHRPVPAQAGDRRDDVDREQAEGHGDAEDEKRVPVAIAAPTRDGRHEEGFAGLANYAAQLTSGAFWRPVNATFVFTISSVCLELLIGLGFALIMNRAPGQHMTRATILVPWVIRHATPAERPALLADAGWPLRVLNRLFETRFRAREELLFAGASP